MLPDEHHRGVELEVHVRLLAEAVPLVLGIEKPHRAAVSADFRHHLLRLAGGNARVVGSLDDEQRLRDPTGVVERGDPLEELGHLRHALVAVFDAAEVAPVALGVLQERREVGNPDDIEGAADPLVVGRGAGERHEATVAAAGDHDAVGVEIGPGGDPIEEGPDVADRILALERVVELHKRLPVAGRPTDVGIHKRHAELAHEEVVAPLKDRP